MLEHELIYCDFLVDPYEDKIERVTICGESYVRGVWADLRRYVIEKYGRICAACGRSDLSGRSLHVDHAYSRFEYPNLTWDPNNLQILCEDCNFSKGAKSVDYRDIRESRSFLDGHPGEIRLDLPIQSPRPRKKYPTPQFAKYRDKPYGGGKFGPASDVRIIDPKTGQVKGVIYANR